MTDLWDRAREGKSPPRWGLRVAIVLALGCLVAAAPAYGRLRDKVLAVRGIALEKVVVRGTNRLQQADIVAASGLRAGMSLVAVDPERVRERLERHPWIRSAEVRRRWPAEVVVEIVEREPVALLLVAGEPYLIDAEGAVFKKAEPEDRVDLPVVTGVEEDLLKSEPEYGRTILAEASRLLRDIEASDFGRRVSELHRDGGGEYSVVTASGTVVALGVPGEEARTIQAVDRAIPGIRAKFGAEPVAVAVMGDGSLAVKVAGRGEGRPEKDPGPQPWEERR